MAALSHQHICILQIIFRRFEERVSILLEHAEGVFSPLRVSEVVRGVCKTLEAVFVVLDPAKNILNEDTSFDADFLLKFSGGWNEFRGADTPDINQNVRKLYLVPRGLRLVPLLRADCAGVGQIKSFELCPPCNGSRFSELNTHRFLLMPVRIRYLPGQEKYCRSSGRDCGPSTECRNPLAETICFIAAAGEITNCEGPEKQKDEQHSCHSECNVPAQPIASIVFRFHVSPPLASGWTIGESYPVLQWGRAA